MHCYMATVRIPQEEWQRRQILTITEKDDSVRLWNVKELNKYFSGRNWQKYNSFFGVLARQYINDFTVRVLVRVADQQTAMDLIAVYAWDLKPKKMRAKLHRHQHMFR